MKHLQPFESFVNEANQERFANRDNTFYWSESNGQLVYQVPYIFPGQSEAVPTDAKNIEGADRRKLYDIVKKANDAINKEVEAAQKAIAKIGEDAAADFAKAVEAAKK